MSVSLSSSAQVKVDVKFNITTNYYTVNAPSVRAALRMASDKTKGKPSYAYTTVYSTVVANYKGGTVPVSKNFEYNAEVTLPRFGGACMTNVFFKTLVQEVTKHELEHVLIGKTNFLKKVESVGQITDYQKEAQILNTLENEHQKAQRGFDKKDYVRFHGIYMDAYKNDR